MVLSASQLALAVGVSCRDRQLTAQDEVMVRDFTVKMPRNGLPRPERENTRLSACSRHDRLDMLHAVVRGLR